MFIKTKQGTRSIKSVQVNVRETKIHSSLFNKFPELDLLKIVTGAVDLNLFLRGNDWRALGVVLVTTPADFTDVLVGVSKVEEPGLWMVIYMSK